MRKEYKSGGTDGKIDKNDKQTKESIERERGK